MTADAALSGKVALVTGAGIGVGVPPFLLLVRQT